MKFKNRTAKEIALFKQVSLLNQAKANESEVTQDIQNIKSFVGYSDTYEKDIQEQINDINQENNKAPGEIDVVIPSLIPVNATAATLGLTINDVPDTYVANVQASATLTVADIPNVNVQSQGMITVSGTPVLTNVPAEGSLTITAGQNAIDGDTVSVGAETYTFKDTPVGDFDVQIGVDRAATLANLETVINDHSVLVTANLDAVTLTLSAVADGELGNDITLAESSSYITISGDYLEGGTYLAEESITVFDTELFFGDAEYGGDIEIDADPEVLAANIASALSVVEEVSAVADGATVIVTADPEASGGIYKGSGGDVIVFTESATGIAVDGTGTLHGGVSADQLGIGAQTYTFVYSEEPGVLEIPIGDTVTDTAANIAQYVDSPLVTLTADDDEVTIEAIAKGTLGNLIPVATDGTRITKSGVATEGGVNEVLSYVEINGKEYLFTLTGGDDPATDFPEMIPVGLALGDTTTDVADKLETVINASDTNLTAVASIADETDYVNITFNTKGIIGNEVTYTNYLVTEGDITDDANEGYFADGVDGTPGYKGQAYFEIVGDTPTIFISKENNQTTTNDSWVTFEYTTPG